MAFRIDDRILWLGFGAFLFAAGKAIHYALTDLVRLTEIDPNQFEPEKRGEQSANAIAVETLRTLVSSPDHSISAAATSLVISRISNNKPVQDLIWQDMTSKDLALRARGLTAVRYLCEIASAGPSFKFCWEGPSREALTLGNVEGFGHPDENEESSSSSSTGSSSSDDASPTFVIPTHQRSAMMGVDTHGRPYRLPQGELQIVSYEEPRRDESEVPSMTNPIAGWTDVPRARDASEGETSEEARRRRREAMALVIDEDSGMANEG